MKTKTSKAIEFLLARGNLPILYWLKKDILESTRSSTKNHNGLGLSIVKELVYRYNGMIDVKDRVPGEPREGIEIDIWIPIQEIPPADDHEKNGKRREM